MPLRNLILIAVTAIISLLCYEKAERNRYSSVLTEMMGVVERNYIEPVSREQLFQNAMQGMVDRLDPYSGFIPPDEYGRFSESIKQQFGGVGILVEINPETKRLTVMSPLFGTPAYKAGIKPGDTIMTIDGRDTEGLTLHDAVKYMKGEPNTQVTLGILHRGDKVPVDITLTRTIIHTETVLGDRRIEGAKWDYHLQEDPRIAYIRITSFGDETADELRRALVDDEGRLRGFEAIILDLRGNPGGTLQAAVAVSDMFLDRGVIVSTRGRGGVERDVYEADSDLLVPNDIPMAVLIDHYSASASEIVSACLQDHQRAVIVGERSWGKGTVQNVIELEQGKSAVRLTTWSYWRPSGHNIHRKPDATDADEWGVTPNEGMEVKLSDEEAEKVLEARRAKDMYRPYDDDKPAEVPMEEPFDDPQLRKAIEFLQQKLKAQASAAERA